MRFQSTLFRPVLVFLCCICLVLPLAAQTVSGTLTGRIVDSTGAVVSGVNVVAKDSETGLSREAVSNSEGSYLFNFLPLGTYQLTVAASGFSKVQKTGVVVGLNQTTVSDFQLKPASVSQEVEVTGESPLIETASGDVKGTLDARAIEDRPLPTRNFLALVETIPGFQTNAVGGQNNPTLSSGSSVNFNGTGTRGATFQINGVNNDDSSENQNRQGVNVSSIKELQVITNNASAEFGRSYGAVVLVQTKQGTNQIHGDAYWFHVNSATTANEWFNNFRGKKADGSPVAPVPVQRRHQYGFTVGGPIKQDKLFYFLTFDQTKNGGFRTFTRDILRANERTPDPSVTNPADRAWIQGVIARFPNVTPNATTPADPRLYTTTAKFHFPDEDYSGRLDYNINGTNTLNGRYQYSRQWRVPDDIIIGENANQNNRQQNVAMTLTHIYSNRQTGEFRFGLGRRRTKVVIGNGTGPDVPVIRWSTTGSNVTSSPIIGNAGAFPIQRFQTDWQYVYNHVWLPTSRLTVKAGTDSRLGQLNDRADNFNRGFWTFTDTHLVDGFDPFQNFLRGKSFTFQTAYGPNKLGNRLKEYNFYEQNDYKFRPNFTLNFGLRYEYVREPREVHNLVDYGFGDTNAIAPRFAFAYSPGSSDGFIARLTGGPGKSVIRGGFGMFYGRLFQSYFSQSGASIRFNPPNAASLSFPVTTGTSVADPTGGFVFKPGPPTTRVSITVVDPKLTMPYTEQWNMSFERELPMQSALAVTYQGNRGIGLPLYEMLNRAEFPIVAPNSPNVTAINRGVNMNCIDPNLANANPAAGCISISQPRTNDRRPDARYSGNFFIHNGAWSYYNGMNVVATKRFSHHFTFNAAYTWSHSIDTGSEATSTGIDTNVPIEAFNANSMKGDSLFDTRQRFTINYTFQMPWFRDQSKLIGQLLGGWQFSGTNIYATGNPFTVFAGYDVNADGVSGDRPNILDPSILGKSASTPYGAVAGCATCLQQAQRLLNPLAFSPNAAIPTAGRLFTPGVTRNGTLGRNTFRADGQKNWDAALSKSWRVREGKSLMVRVESYNLLNTPQFGVPNQTVTSTLFGQISGQRNNRVDTNTGARYFQAAMRFVF